MKKIAEYDENRVVPMTPRRNDLVVKNCKNDNTIQPNTNLVLRSVQASRLILDAF